MILNSMFVKTVLVKNACGKVLLPWSHRITSWLFDVAGLPNILYFTNHFICSKCYWGNALILRLIFEESTLPDVFQILRNSLLLTHTPSKNIAEFSQNKVLQSHITKSHFLVLKFPMWYECIVSHLFVDTFDFLSCL